MYPDRQPPRFHCAVLRRLLSRSLVGRTILGDLEEEYRSRLIREGQRRTDRWFRNEARRLCVRELRERLMASSSWRLRRRGTSLVGSGAGNGSGGSGGSSDGGRGGSDGGGSGGSRGGALWVGLASLAQDARFALRSIAVYRWRSVAAAGMLAVAIGIFTAMFTAVDALVLRPVPFDDIGSLARLLLRDDSGRGLISVSPRVFRAWRESGAFARVEAARGSSAVVEFDGGEVSRTMARVTPGVFELLGGVRPLHGRLFGSSAGRPGGDDSVLISEDLWRSVYRADPTVVGSTVSIDGRPATVVGVLPSAFRFPSANTVIWRADSFEDPSNRPPMVYVRFAPDIPRDDALAVATRVAHGAGAADELHASPGPLGSRLDEYYERVIRMIAGGVVLLFVVLCANVAGLLLGGLSSRVREISTRTALGAPRARLVRQALLESTMLGFTGAAAGAGLAWVLVTAVRRLLPQAAFISSLNTPDIDLRALGAASIAGLVATLAVGVVPAAWGTRPHLNRLLQTGGYATPTGQARIATRSLLVCQVALSCTLVFGATLLVRSFVNLVNEDRGLDVHDVLTVLVEFPDESFPSPESRLLAAEALGSTARTLPGVAAVSWSHGTPPYGSVYAGEWTSDAPGAEPVSTQVFYFIADREFLDLYRVPLLRGRSFRATDDRSAVLVSERFAESLWPGQDPLGRRFTSDQFEGVPFQVIGVVGDIRYPSLERTADDPEIYGRLTEIATFLVTLNMRCEEGCPDTAWLRRQMSAADTRVRIRDIADPESRYASQFVRPRVAATLGAAFAAIALIAAGAGLFSLFSQSVIRRRRELGIRTALGAEARDIRRLVWGEGVTVAALGIGLGGLASVWLTRLLSSLMFGVATTDPLSWSIVAASLAAAVVAAAWGPTQKAVKASPVTLLREH